MADGAQLNEGSGGLKAVTAEVTFSGETMHAQGIFPGIITGSADAYTYNIIVGGAGTVSAGVQRMTLASDDPAVALLTTIDADTSNLGAILTALQGTLTVDLGANNDVTLATLPDTSAGDLAAINAALAGTIAVDGSGVTQPVSDAGGSITVDDGGTSLTVDGTVAVTDGGGSITVDGAVSVSGEVDVLPASPVATDYLPIRLSNGTAFISALPITDNDGSITVDGTVTVQDGGGAISIDDNGGSITVDASSLPLPTGASTEATLSTLNGKVTACNTGAVVLSSGTVTTLTTLTGSSIAHDSADSGNPHKIGAKAISALSGATLVASADRTNVYADLDGALLIREDAALGDLVSGNASNTDGSSTSLIAAQGAGVKTYITDITITNTSATDIYVELKDGATAKWTFPVPGGGGVTHGFRKPLAGTANTAWNFDPSAAATTVYCSASGFKSKV